MWKHRIIGFSDGVIAIALTIIVLEIEVPDGNTFASLRAIGHALAAYAISFTFIAIYWNNHHHLFQSAERVDGKVLWANNVFLFFITLVSFSTGWVGSTDFARDAVALYGFNAVLCGAAYSVLARALSRIPGNEKLRGALWADAKSAASILLLTVGAGAAFVTPYLALGLYGAVAIVWAVPDRRIESAQEWEPEG